MFDPDKIIENIFMDEVYLSASDKYPYRADISEDGEVASILISTEMPKFQIRSLPYPEISRGDKIYVCRNGDAHKVQRTVKNVKIPNNELYSSMTLELTNISSDIVKNMNTFNISGINSDKVQIGENNHMPITINITELVEKVANSGDPQAKSMLKQLLENSTVASIVGAGASALLGLL